MLNLKVKNFGVLKDIDITLNKTNLFIGENGSGKSVLAKLITIVTSFDNYSDDLLKEFIKLDIDFIDEDTKIVLSDEDCFIIKIEDKGLIFSDKVLDVISNINKTEEFFNSFENPDNISNEEILPKKFISQYIPADRNLISVLNRSIYSLLTSDIPLPKHLLNFAGQYEKARNEIKELDILGMTFKSQKSEDRIYYSKDGFLPLEYSSSGIQTALPLHLTLKYFDKKYNEIVIEEPEQNLYPKSQVDTTKFIIENSSRNLHLMTHSPYILSTLNILLFAYKAANTNETLKEKINKLIPESQQIDSEKFSAYFIEDGKSIDIKSSRGLISENAIDESSNSIDDEFNQLMEIYREYKND